MQSLLHLIEGKEIHSTVRAIGEAYKDAMKTAWLVHELLSRAVGGVHMDELESMG